MNEEVMSRTMDEILNYVTLDGWSVVGTGEDDESYFLVMSRKGGTEWLNKEDFRSGEGTGLIFPTEESAQAYINMWHKLRDREDVPYKVYETNLERLEVAKAYMKVMVE